METLRFILQLHVNCHTSLLKGRQKLKFRNMWHSPALLTPCQSKELKTQVLPSASLPASAFWIQKSFDFSFLPDSVLVKGNRLHSVHMCRADSQVFPSPSGQTTTEEMPEREALVSNPKLRVHGQNHLVDFRTHFKEQPLDRTF